MQMYLLCYWKKQKVKKIMSFFLVDYGMACKQKLYTTSFVRSIFTTFSNIYSETFFCENSQRLLTANYLRKKVKMMMMNCFCGKVDKAKVFSLISSQDHCQRSSPSRISDTEPAQNLSSGSVEWSFAVVITTTPRRYDQ